MFHVNGLQKICDCLSENPSWSLAHLVAYFNLTEQVKNPKIIEFLDYPDHDTFMTPLQLAAKVGNFEMVKVLLPCCKLEHLDNSSNSVFHYAAGTTKEMINVSDLNYLMKANAQSFGFK
jgi:calcium-independent phospholipase A2